MEFDLNKSLLTNVVALFVFMISFVLPDEFAKYFRNAGLFALSGALTNQLAIHMLFEKVPFLYGSGIIIDRFESFKTSIKEMIMRQFFTKEQLDNFFASEEKKFDLSEVINKTDFSLAFDALSSSVMESKFGGMIAMFGGASVIESLREPFVAKLKASTIEISKSDDFQKSMMEGIKNSSITDDLQSEVEKLIDNRLNELTPIMVKEIIYEIISIHLGWLVVWGGVFGGAIGLIGAFLM